MEDSKKIKVVNNSAGVVAYSLPELNNLYRTFNKDESKEVTFGEMRMLSYIPGGETLIKDYLTIMDKDAVAELIGIVNIALKVCPAGTTETLPFSVFSLILYCSSIIGFGVIGVGSSQLKFGRAITLLPITNKVATSIIFFILLIEL